MNVPIENVPPEQYSANAFQWLTRAADHGVVDAQVTLGDLNLNGGGIPVNPSQAAQLYQSAANKGNMNAEAMVGWLYSHGLGVKWDADEAQKDFHKAIDGGFGLGLWGLADMYMSGNGVPANHTLGMSLYSQAAAKGCANRHVWVNWEHLMLSESDHPDQAIT